MNLNFHQNLDLTYDRVGGNWKALNGEKQEISAILGKNTNNLKDKKEGQQPDTHAEELNNMEYKFKKGDLTKLEQASAQVDKRNSLQKPAAHTMSGVMLKQQQQGNDLKVISDKALYINEPSEKGTSPPPYNMHN